MSNLGRWEPWYASLTPDALPRPYGGSASYEMGARWLKDCPTVEDWGCGYGWARQFYAEGQYRGIDGTVTPFADEVADLAVRDAPGAAGIFMRGVVEHDYRWAKILDNAYRSFAQRMCLVLFTPMVLDGPKEIDFVTAIGVPDLSFSYANILDPMRRKAAGSGSIKVLIERLESPDTGYGQETVFLMEK